MAKWSLAPPPANKNPVGTSFQESFSMSKLKFAMALALLVAAAIVTGSLASLHTDALGYDNALSKIR
jgi:hypothetical protein